jgi:hypothetical protein
MLVKLTTVAQGLNRFPLSFEYSEGISDLPF